MNQPTSTLECKGSLLKSLDDSADYPLSLLSLFKSCELTTPQFGQLRLVPYCARYRFSKLLCFAIALDGWHIHHLKYFLRSASGTISDLRAISIRLLIEHHLTTPLVFHVQFHYAWRHIARIFYGPVRSTLFKITNVAYRPALHLSMLVFVVCITIMHGIVLINVLAHSISNQ